MQIQKIQSSEPSFGGIRSEKGLTSNKNRRAVFEHISEELNKIDPSDRPISSFFAKLFSKKSSTEYTPKRSYVDRADSFGEDVLFTKDDENNKAVRFYIVQQEVLKEPIDYSKLNNSLIYVGTYSKPEEFDIQHFKNKYKPIESFYKLYIAFVNSIVCIGIPFAIYLMANFYKNGHVPYVEKSNNATTIIKDTTTTDNIKPILNLEDSLKLGKKVKK